MTGVADWAYMLLDLPPCDHHIHVKIHTRGLQACETVRPSFDRNRTHTPEQRNIQETVVNGV